MYFLFEFIFMYKALLKSGLIHSLTPVIMYFLFRQNKIPQTFTDTSEMSSIHFAIFVVDTKVRFYISPPTVRVIYHQKLKIKVSASAGTKHRCYLVFYSFKSVLEIYVLEGIRLIYRHVTSKIKMFTPSIPPVSTVLRRKPNEQLNTYLLRIFCPSVVQEGYQNGEVINVSHCFICVLFICM